MTLPFSLMASPMTSSDSALALSMKPQVFVFSPSDQFTIAVPGIDGTRQFPLLLKSNFFDVTAC